MTPLFNLHFYFYVKNQMLNNSLNWFSAKFIIEIFLKSCTAYRFAEEIRYFIIQKRMLATKFTVTMGKDGELKDIIYD